MTAAFNSTQHNISEGWRASLALRFERRHDRTVLVHNQHEGPLRVQRPFYPEQNGQAHVYILHPPGGIVAGDMLSIQASFGSGAHGLLTTPSAGRVYKSNFEQLTQSQQTVVQVDDGGWAEWLPQENIVFNGAQARNVTQVKLQGGARFIGWEITCLGRPASKEWFEQGELNQRFELFRDGQPLLLERSHFNGGAAILQAPWGMQGFTATGTLLCTLEEQALLTVLKALCESIGQSQENNLRIAATALPGLLVVRGLAHNAAPLRNGFIECWRRMRWHLLQQQAVAPRIWFT